MTLPPESTPAAPVSRLHLIDATFELFRAYFAMPSSRAPDGREVGAIRGLIASMLSLLRGPGVTHVAAATDHVIESFRNQLFSGYKTGEGIPPDLFGQFPLAEEALRAIGIVVWPMVEFEADDALASAADRFVDRVQQVVICSPDKDLTQCVIADRVVTHDRIRSTTLDEAGVRARYGIPPACIPDWLALVGDTADGIPGIPGWGAKTSATLLAAYGSLEAIPFDPAGWPPTVRGRDRLAATLRDRFADAQLYKTLATLRRDAPLPQSFDDLEWRGVPRDQFHDLCARLGFNDLATRPSRWRVN